MAAGAHGGEVIDRLFAEDLGIAAMMHLQVVAAVAEATSIAVAFERRGPELGPTGRAQVSCEVRRAREDGPCRRRRRHSKFAIAPRQPDRQTGREGEVLREKAELYAQNRVSSSHRAHFGEPLDAARELGALRIELLGIAAMLRRQVVDGGADGLELATEFNAVDADLTQ